MENIQQLSKAQLALNYKRDFLPEFMVAKVMHQLRSVCSMEMAIKENMPTLGSIRKLYGEEKAHEYIMSWIFFLDKFLGLKHEGDEFRLKETAWLILYDYYNLTIADIYLIIRKAMKSEFGKYYDRLSGATILSWFREYFEERCNLCEMLTIQKDQALKQSRYREADILSERRVESAIKP